MWKIGLRHASKILAYLSGLAELVGKGLRNAAPPFDISQSSDLRFTLKLYFVNTVQGDAKHIFASVVYGNHFFELN